MFAVAELGMKLHPTCQLLCLDVRDGLLGLRLLIVAESMTERLQPRLHYQPQIAAPHLLLSGLICLLLILIVVPLCLETSAPAGVIGLYLCMSLLFPCGVLLIAFDFYLVRGCRSGVWRHLLFRAETALIAVLRLIALQVGQLVVPDLAPSAPACWQAQLLVQLVQVELFLLGLLRPLTFPEDLRAGHLLLLLELFHTGCDALLPS